MELWISSSNRYISTCTSLAQCHTGCLFADYTSSTDVSNLIHTGIDTKTDCTVQLKAASLGSRPSDGLFAVLDGGRSTDAPAAIRKTLESTLLEELTDEERQRGQGFIIKEKLQYLVHTFLSAHRLGLSEFCSKIALLGHGKRISCFSGPPSKICSSPFFSSRSKITKYMPMDYFYIAFLHVAIMHYLNATTYSSSVGCCHFYVLRRAIMANQFAIQELSTLRFQLCTLTLSVIAFVVLYNISLIKKKRASPTLMLKSFAREPFFLPQPYAMLLLCIQREALLCSHKNPIMLTPCP